jgi:DNA-3-methyladenine glycosylase II
LPTIPGKPTLSVDGNAGIEASKAVFLLFRTDVRDQNPMPTTKKMLKKQPGSIFEFSVPLPPDYAPTDVVSFHGRDTEAVSEIVTESRLRKGILLNDFPTVFDIDFAAVKNQAICQVVVDGSVSGEMQQEAFDITTGLIGLRLDPVDFTTFVSTDPVFGPLTKRQKSLRIVQSASIFEALTWAIMGQQINVSFAVSLRRTFVRLAGRQHSSGLLCYPSPTDAAQIPLEALTSRQYSRSKAETILRLASLVATGELSLEAGPENSVESICRSLLKVKGIGPWTVNYAMLRGYGHADCSLHGDVAVRAAIAKLMGHDVRPDVAAAEIFLKSYSPHRTMAAAHLWASLKETSNY